MGFSAAPPGDQSQQEIDFLAAQMGIQLPGMSPAAGPPPQPPPAAGPPPQPPPQALYAGNPGAPQDFSQPQKKQKVGGKGAACWFYMRGLCAKADWCAYSHEAESVAQAQISEDQSESFPAWKTQYCRFWLKSGKCRFAHYCLYAHTEEELRSRAGQSPAEAHIAAMSLLMSKGKPGIPGQAPPVAAPTTTDLMQTANFDMNAYQAAAASATAAPQYQSQDIAAAAALLGQQHQQDQANVQQLGDLQAYLAQLAALGALPQGQ